MAEKSRLFEQLVRLLKDNQGSDLHMLEGEKPRLRIRGDLRQIESKERPLVLREDIEGILEGYLTHEQRKVFDDTHDIDFSVELEGASGRVNVGLANGRRMYLTMRYLPQQIIPLERLGIDAKMLKALADAEDGIILVAGETSSGKTTTIAAILDYINHNRHGAISTIENPVEYVLPSDKCLISRREVGRDTPDFRTALRSSVRKNPDVLLIGEIRDFETVSTALSAAETGIQTFCTMHALGAMAAITRMANIMTTHGQKEEEFYLRLSNTLRGIISQELVKAADGKTVFPIYEILNISFAEKTYLREKDFIRLEQSLESDRNISMGLCLYRLWRAQPRRIGEDVIRRIYGDQFNLAMNRMNDRAGWKPIIATIRDGGAGAFA